MTWIFDYQHVTVWVRNSPRLEVTGFFVTGSPIRPESGGKLLNFYRLEPLTTGVMVYIGTILSKGKVVPFSRTYNISAPEIQGVRLTTRPSFFKELCNLVGNQTPQKCGVFVNDTHRLPYDGVIMIHKVTSLTYRIKAYTLDFTFTMITCILIMVSLVIGQVPVQ